MATDTLRATFVSETEDLLVQMEDGLLQLESTPDDKEVLNAIFRSGHTVKGSAGLLGFKEIVAFTHVLENVLDRLRKAELRIDGALTSVLLEGKDVIGAMVACVAAERPVEGTARQAEVLEALRAHADLGRLEVRAAAPSAPRTASAVPTTYRVRLALGPDVLEQGQDPYLLLLELGDLGEVLGVEAHAESLPPFDQLDAFKCHLSWTVVLRSTAAADRLLEVFVFVKEEGAVEVQQVLDCAHWM
jgi:two-component system chemotaxis sensor kinase CheA